MDIIKDILPRKKVRDRQIVENYISLRLEPELEDRLISVVIKYVNNPDEIILQKRSKKLKETTSSDEKQNELRLVVPLQLYLYLMI